MKNLRKKYNHYILNSRQNYSLAIVSGDIAEDDFLDKTAEKLYNGCDILQIQNGGISDKDFLELCKKVKTLCAEFNVLFLIEGRCDIAFLCEADGVHLQKDSINIHAAREILGENRIIGISCKNSEECKAAIHAGADYILTNFDLEKQDLEYDICVFKNGNPIQKLF